MRLSHWRSFKQYILPTLDKRLAPHFHLEQDYADSLAKYTEVDWYGFQRLPLFRSIFELSKLLEKYTNPAQAYSQFLALMQESYHVMSFEKAGFKVIKPSAPLVEVLKDVAVEWQLKDIAPPSIQTYIEVPLTADLWILGASNEKIPVVGAYVTWGPIGAATQQTFAEMREKGIQLDKWGVINPASGEQGMTSVPVTEDVVGSNYFRCLLVGKVGDEHSVHFFKMHWSTTGDEMAEGAFTRVQETLMTQSSDHSQLAGSRVGDLQDVRTRAFHLICNLFLYMSQPVKDQDVEYRPNPDRAAMQAAGHHWNNKRRKRMKRKLADEMPPDEWLVGQHIVIDKSIDQTDTPSATGGPGSSQRPHWRRQHWHRYWVIENEVRKLVPRLIAPILVNKAKGEPPAETTWEVR